jgi:hypothetical protein
VRAATYLGNQHAVAALHAHGQPLAVLADSSRADGQDLALVELLDARLREEDARRRLGLGLDALHEHAVEQGDEGLDGADRGGLFYRGMSALLPMSGSPQAVEGR